MAFTGNIGALRLLSERIVGLVQVPGRASKKVAEEIPPLLQEEFTAGKDPHGSPWTPLAPSTIAKGRTDPPLTDTTKMRSSARAMAVSRTGVAVMVDAPAGYHQTGYHQAGKPELPARPIVPVNGQLPTKWVEVVRAAVESEIEEVRRKL